VAFYPRAIPQYNLGYGRFLKQMDEAEAKAPGLFLAGHYRDGVSLSASIVSGIKASERIAAHLSSRQIHLNFESCRAA
jgi:oxygen-dependent protoporphyrinogen oxidase